MRQKVFILNLLLFFLYLFFIIKVLLYCSILLSFFIIYIFNFNKFSKHNIFYLLVMGLIILNLLNDNI